MMLDKIRISDHAVLRYLERHYNLDIEKIKNEILPEKIRKLVEAGAIRFTVNGISFRMDGETVVTGVKPSTARLKKHKRHYSNKKEKDKGPYYKKGKRIDR